MYNNSGVKIKNIASVWMVVDSIITVLLAAVFYSAVSADGGGAAFLIAIIILGIGLAIAWLSYLLLYGFGELIAETCYTCEALENLTEELETSGYAKKLQINIVRQIPLKITLHGKTYKKQIRKFVHTVASHLQIITVQIVSHTLENKQLAAEMTCCQFFYSFFQIIRFSKSAANRPPHLQSGKSRQPGEALLPLKRD